MTNKVKAFLAVLLAAAIAGMGYSYYDASPVMKIAESVQKLSISSDAQQDTAGLAAPHYIIAGDGSYEYKITDRYMELPEEMIVSGAADNTEYASFLAALKRIFSTGNAPVLVDENAENTIRESFTKSSLTAVFEYDVPLAEFLSFNDIPSRGASLAGGICRITIFEDGSAALYDRNTRQYYHKEAPVSEEIRLQDTLRKMIGYAFDNPADSSPIMQSLTSLTGVDNPAMMPVGSQIAVGKSNFISEYDVSQPADMELVKSGFYPQGMDFVNDFKKADGSRILMYGVGRQLLKFSTDGCLIYSEELNTESYKRCRFFESLEHAAAFISTRGGQTEELADLDLFIKNVSVISRHGCSGYHIDFGASKAGLDVMYKDGILLSVDIFGTQVTSCIRNLPDLRGAEMLDTPVEAMDGTELIRMNSDTIASIILEMFQDDSSINTEKYSSSDTFYAVASGIADTRLSLVRLDASTIQAAESAEQESSGTGTAAAGQQFVPAWYLLIEGVEFWFDAENGNLLSYEKY